MEVAFLFPGQGSQFVGMGAEVIRESKDARDLIKKTRDVLKFDLEEIITEGPEEKLALTEIAQPAILTISTILLEELKKAIPAKPGYLAGHSLGEYSACVCGGVLSFENAVKIVHLRGKYMQSAVPVGEGAMCAVIGLEESVVSKILCSNDFGGAVEIANYNSPEQIVISGEAEAVKKAGEVLKEEGARRCVFLKVSAPFHCSLMKPAQDNLSKLLYEIEFSDSRIPVVSNVDAKPHSEGDTIKNLLIEQVTSSVRWSQIIQYLYNEGIRKFVEIGPGRVLSGLTKRILKNKEIEVISIEDKRGVENAVSALS